jgi:oxaloacetate decarboxylase (Na+ extruding) subunit gamma
VAEDQLLTDALTLMGLGMGTVFVFLTLLVYVTSQMSVLVNRLVPQKVVPDAPPVTPSPTGKGVDQTLLAVISAAVHAHRSRH